MIEVQGATMYYIRPKRYRELLLHPFRGSERTRALHPLQLKIPKGSCIGLLGPNGAGKTTLLKLLGGVLYPTSGAVRINGLDTIRDNQAAKQVIGLAVNDERSFYWRLTGIQNLQFFGSLQNLFGPALDQRIAEVLSYVGLENAADVVVSNYSSGMRQRLAIARGFLSDPAILLLDEPTRALDPLGAEDVRKLISEWVACNAAKTLVIATNQIADLVGVCDNIYLIFDGRIVGTVSGRNQTEEDLFAFYATTLSDLGVSNDFAKGDSLP